MILLAVLVFVALLLPLITLVLTSINTESVSTAEAIKGAKAELAAEKAINDAIALVVQQKALPDYWTSAAQPNTAVIVRDTVTGERRNLIDTSTAGNVGAGVDDVYGTEDDYYVGPRGDRSYWSAADSAASSRNYRYDFAFSQLNGPSYIGQPWSFSTENRPFTVSPFTGGTIWFLNQYAAEDAGLAVGASSINDNNGDGVPDGYDVSNSTTPFVDDEPTLQGPGYYPGADGGPEHPVLADLADPGQNAGKLLADSGVEEAMYNAKVNLYQAVFTDLDRGPLPTSMLKSYANVTDEAGRLNLNIFCKKVKVFMPESADTDYDFSGSPTDDFNGNESYDELGWKWMDNPLFPDRYGEHSLDFNPTSGQCLPAPGDRNNASSTLLDWCSIDLASGYVQFDDTPDGQAMPEIGEDVQHYYEGDTDGDGIPQSVESMETSLNMLMALGLTGVQAARLLTYVNPPHDAGGADPESDPWEPSNPASKTYRTLRADLNGVATLPYNNSNPLSSDPSVSFPNRRLDACNLTPPLFTLVQSGPAPGIIDQYSWDFDFPLPVSAPYRNSQDVDDMPLPPPHPLNNLDELLGIPGFSDATLDMLRKNATIFSYDTNVIANYVSDVAADADLVNAYKPGDPQYNGSTVRRTPQRLRDTDNVADLRFDVSRYVFGLALSDYRRSAEEMYAYIREHLPRPLLDKMTLPTVDRMGRADPADSMAANDDPRYDLNNPGTLVKLLPHRDSSAHPYNVGAQGHEMDNGGEVGAGYPALNPAFSLDSCLSIVLYRSGSQFQTDDYTFNPQGGAWNASFIRLPFGRFGGLMRRLSGPYASYIQTLLQQLGLNFSSDPDSLAGFNQNPVIRPHGPSTMDASNLVNPGSMDSPADLLDVPLYKFGRLSASMMADPPSGFRWDRSNPIGSVNPTDPNESAPVNYYLAFSDVVDYTWYLQNVAPYGPDGRADTGDEPDQSRVLYTVYFTYANRPVAPAGDISPAGTWDAVVPITGRQLMLLSGGTPDQGSKVTIGFFNPQPPYTDPATNRQYTGGKFFIDDDYVTDPRNVALPPAARPTGTLRPIFTWRDVPLPEEDGTAGAVGADADGRPNDPGDWPAGYIASEYTLQGGVTPWAYDENGDPYLSARCEVVNNWKNPAAPPERQERADDESKVYLQYNARAEIPFRVSILPVRVSGSEFEIRSAYGGEQTWNGAYLLYDWTIPGYTTSYDGTWPDPQPGQTGDPRVIRVTPRDTSGTGAPVDVSLRLYDLRAFVDASDPDGPGALMSLPISSGTVNLGAAIWTGSEVFGRTTYNPIGTGTFPLSYVAAPGTPTDEDPSEIDPGYAYDASRVESIDSGAVVRAQITALKPSVYSDDADVSFHAGAVGGQLNYTYRIQVLSPQFGDPANPAQTYPGPDMGLYGGDGNTWPGPYVTYPWEVTTAMPRHSELSALTFPNPPLAATYVADSYYRATQAGSVLLSSVANNVDQADITRSFDFTGLHEAWYWVEVAVWDNNAPGMPGIDPADSYAYTKVYVSTDREPGGSTGIPPEVNASIWVRPLEASGEVGTRQLGFNCGVAVDGGTGGYSYYWEVDGPVYDTTNDAITSVGVVGTAQLAVGVDNRAMTSNEPNPRFAFNPDPGPGLTPYGTYFVHCYVMDHASSPPATAPATVAHDVVMITLNDTGGSFAGPSDDSLSRTPMAVLSALPPGNGSVAIGQNSRGVAGNNRPFLGSSMLAPDKPVVDPDIAAVGQTIVIRGYNFNPSPQNNTVRFAGDVDAHPFSVRTLPASEANPYDPPGPTGPYDQMELYVQVPPGALPGYLNVTTSGGTSERVFFQTAYDVTFDLIGSLSVNDPTMLHFELDYQGDGHIDYEQDLVVDSGGGVLDGATEGITHDYAEDGVGNYEATLIVTDMLSGRKQVSHQLVAIKDLRATAGFLTIAVGQASDFYFDGGTSHWMIRDDNARFLSMGAVDASWSVYNTNTSSPNYGTATTVYQPAADNLLPVGGNIFAIGDTYEVRKRLDQPVNNAMVNNAWPTVEMRSDTFTAQPGDGMTFNSAVGGVSSTGLKYKWALNLNDVTGTAPTPQTGRVDFTASGIVNQGGFPPVFIVTTSVNWTYLNLPALPFNVFDDTDSGAIWRVTAVPGNNVPGYGVLGATQLRVEYLSGGTAPYDWVAGEAGHYGTGAAGGNQVTSGLVYDVPGGANFPDYGRLDNILIDQNNNFRQAGPRGVTVGDLAFNDTDGSLATVYSIDSNIQLRMDNGQDPTHVIGLLNGGPIGRAGTLSGRSPDLGPGAPFQAIYDITQAGYNWHGRGAGTGEGGFIVGDGDPSVFVDENGAALPYAGDSFFRNTTDSTLWRVIGVNIPPVPNDDTMRVQFLGTYPNGLGIPVGPNQGLRQFNVANTTSLGGAPPVYVLDTSIDWTVLNLPALPFFVYNFADGNAQWRVTALPGQNVPGFGVLANNQIRVEYLLGGTPPYNWLPGELGYIILNAQWAIGDLWQSQFPRNQWRVNYDYHLTTMSAGIGGDQPQGTVWADCAFADIDAPVDFYVEIQATYGMALPSTVEFDWDGDGTADDSALAELQASGSSGSVQQVKVTHAFQAFELPPVSTKGVSSQALYRTLTTAVGQSTPYVSAWQLLPVVTVGGDDFDTSLRTLNLDWSAQAVHGWDNTKWNRVNLETCYSVSYNMLETSAPGLNNTVRRWNYAVDQLLIPPGMQDYTDTLSTWVSYSKPFVYVNNTGATTMRHQAVHGTGSALNWVSDANADGRWMDPTNPANNVFESPLGSNPVNYHEFVFQNGANQMNVPGGMAISGASFPRALPGVGRADVTGGFVYYQARKGTYNGFGFVSDNLPQVERAFSFDSQAFFWGDRLSNQGTATRDTRADFYVNPLIGGNTQIVQLTSFVTSASETDNYTYVWTVTRRPAGGATPFPWTNVGPNPVFSPSQAAQAAVGPTDSGAGTYDVFLQVNGAGGTYSAKRTFEVRQLPLNALLMANPPSGTVEDQIQFPIFAEGGVPPYQVSIDYGDGSAPVNRSMDQGSEMTFSHSYMEAGDYTVTLTVTDSVGNTDTDTEVVNISESVPLNATLMLTPASGVAPFGIEIWYAVSGGSPISTPEGNGYDIIIRLVNTSGRTRTMVERTAANTFGANGRPDDLRLPLADDDPVFMMVPAPGNYYVELIAFDNSGRVASDSDDVFASGYLVVNEYGNTAPQVVRDMENRPMHAVRIWRDPWLSRGQNSGNEDYANTPDVNSLAGGRLMEGDLQVIGDVITTDPNPSFRSFGMNATKDPLSQPLYYADYTLSTSGQQQVQDFYDTFTEGRININTATEDVLTALFRKCVRQRSYGFSTIMVLGEPVRRQRNTGGDAFVSEDEARAMARAVVKYRAAYYDIHKPTPEGAGADFGYVQSPNAGSAAVRADLGNDFRVDHLPAIGPWDGVNPHEYAYDDRDAALQEPDEPINNAWDNMAASYYNFSTAGAGYLFYAPSDVAFVRTPWDVDIQVIDENTGQSFAFDYREPLSNYAKYLNDTVMNTYWDSDRGTFYTDWALTGFYELQSGYSPWAFDARNYLSYAGGRVDAQVSVPLTGAPTVTFSVVAGSQEDVGMARNRLSVFTSNGETAYTYIPNPPFRNLFDLFNVIDANEKPATWPINDTTGGGAAYTLELSTSGAYDQTTILNSSNIAEGAQVYSGPSVFRYVAQWDDQSCEFITLANYLDDIAPYVTCRSYTYRIEASGAVEPSGGSSAAETGASSTSRDRTLTAVIDVGPLWAHRRVDEFPVGSFGNEPGAADIGPGYTVLWRKDGSQ
jgi:hypothetical protein